ncbi:MAG: 4Fe-4S binding protein [Candidatus Bathyarchaeota archaeon]|nr:4Fe-4S binding protein [Candidatus Bathyarchaeum tardum]WGM90207.1 MAG: 4Fe-4S binding protein [Candidatus Bathyarchaeum tardum]WNZ29706.1 MAG: 4Fe-4S binding protein [Candidatus Bathyarchaeota archaeon]
MLEIIAETLRATIAVALILAGSLAILIWVRNNTRKLSALRLFIQIAAVAVIFLGLIIGPFGLERWSYLGTAPKDITIGKEILGRPYPDGLTVPTFSCYYASGRTATCVIWQLQSYLFPNYGTSSIYLTTGLERLAIAVGLLVVISVIFGRFLCGWICPFGLYMDLLTRLRKALKIRHWTLSDRVNEGLRQARYLIIAAFLILSFLLGMRAIAGVELISESELGRYLEIPFCQICPAKPLFVLVEGALGFMDVDYMLSQTIGDFALTGWYLTSINIVILGVVTVGSFMIRRLWCRICPLGGLIALFSRFGPFKKISLIKLTKVEEKCTKCGICKRVCPPQVTEVYEDKGGDVTVSSCILCFRCVEMCPYEGCLNVEFAGKPIYKSKNWLNEEE